MMPVCNAHGLDRTWVEPPPEQVQEFFDSLSERATREDPILIHPTTDEEIAYIASRAEEANLAAEAGDFGFMGEDTSEETAPEETSTEQEEIVGE